VESLTLFIIKAFYCRIKHSKALTSLFCRSFTKELRKIGAYDMTYSKGHFNITGFFTVKEQAYYFSLSDVRSGFCYPENLLLRTAKNYKDYTGGGNMYVIIQSGMYRDLAVKCGLNLSELITYTKPKKTIKGYADDFINHQKEGVVTKRITSMKKANEITWKLIDHFNVSDKSISYRKCGRTLIKSWHENELFTFNYDCDSKQMLVNFLN
jgi:hypothetical protein